VGLCSVTSFQKCSDEASQKLGEASGKAPRLEKRETWGTPRGRENLRAGDPGPPDWRPWSTTDGDDSSGK